MKHPVLLLCALIVAPALILAGYIAGVRHSSPQASTATPADKRVLYWYDPMIPTEHHDQPGLSSMGMQMIPKYAGQEDREGGVTIAPETAQNLGLRTALVEQRVLEEAIKVPGTITWDLDEASIVSARADGIITRLAVREPYSSVSKGAPLAELTAPAWSSAVAEYTALGQTRSPDAQALRSAARERLAVLGLEAGDLHSIDRNGAVTLHATQSGVVTRIEVREGQRVNAGQTLMMLNGLAKVWIDAALPQALAGAVHPGTPVSVSADALPGRRLAGTVQAMLPDLDGSTRTQRARIVLANPDGALSPGMFVQVGLQPTPGEATPIIPDEALIATGEQARVIVADDGNRFHPVAVRTGRSAGGYTQILAGLRAGQRIVLSGQFLIDSEASLSGALERLSDPDGSSTDNNDRMSMPMDDMPAHPGSSPAMSKGAQR
ncbi:efflux RND transporter periplasmic adaptor subunit [Dyella choica]|uniref:Efflux RND transporter periplasmic adaptor subunit n=1 Tax=Dyella choica TaxID=1927959 RepID=A0A3S0PKQ4_9GAMM|nr:efflux RND transporter periplasmic adaptor subunit [Dyella choica]RUL70883.1 efflux RND transporter periplasmic adaptor subunit [Dyella choica]